MARQPNKNVYEPVPADNVRDDGFQLPIDGVTFTRLNDVVRKMQSSITNLGDATLGTIGDEIDGFLRTDNIDTVDGGDYFYAEGAVGSPDARAGGAVSCSRKGQTFRTQTAITANGDVFTRVRAAAGGFSGQAWKQIPNTPASLARLFEESVDSTQSDVAVGIDNGRLVLTTGAGFTAADALIEGTFTVSNTANSGDTVTVAETAVTADSKIDIIPINGIATGSDIDYTLTLNAGVGFVFNLWRKHSSDYIGPGSSDDLEFAYRFVNDSGRVSLKGQKGDTGPRGQGAYASITELPDVDADHNAGDFAKWDSANAEMEFDKPSLSDLKEAPDSVAGLQNKMLTYRDGKIAGRDIVQGATTFTGLTDTPNNLQGDKFLATDALANIILADAPSLGFKHIGTGVSGNITNNENSIHNTFYSTPQTLAPAVTLPAKGDWFWVRVGFQFRTQTTWCQRIVARTELTSIPAGVAGTQIDVTNNYSTLTVPIGDFIDSNAGRGYVVLDSSNNLMPLWSHRAHSYNTASASDPVNLRLELYEITGTATGPLGIRQINSAASVFTPSSSQVNQLIAPDSNEITVTDDHAEWLFVSISSAAGAYETEWIEKSVWEALGSTATLPIGASWKIGRAVVSNENRVRASFSAAGTYNMKLFEITTEAGGSGTSLTDEQIQDIVGAMVQGNIETGASLTYDDALGKLDLAITQKLIDQSDTPSSYGTAGQVLKVNPNADGLIFGDESGAASPTTLLELTDTPSAYDNGKILESTASGTQWVDKPTVTTEGKLKGIGALPSIGSYTDGDGWLEPHVGVYERIPASGASATVSLNGWSPAVSNVQGQDSLYGFDLRSDSTRQFGSRPPGVPASVTTMYMDSNYRYTAYATAGTFTHTGLIIRTGGIDNRLTYQSTANGRDLFWSNLQGNTSGQWTGAALGVDDSVSSLGTKPFTPTGDTWSRVLTQGVHDPSAIYEETKSILKAGQGARITADDTSESLTLSTAVPSGNKLPANPHVGDRFRLLADDSIVHNFVGRLVQTQTNVHSIRLRGAAPFADVWVDFFLPGYTGPNSGEFAGNVYIRGFIPTINDRLILGDTGVVPVEYGFRQVPVSGQTQYYRVLNISGSVGDDLTVFRQFNLRRGSTKAFPDVTVTKGDRTFSGEDDGQGGWIATPGIEEEGQRIPQSWITLLDGTFNGLSPTSTSQDQQGALQLLSPAGASSFSLNDYESGLFDITIDFTIATRSTHTLGWNTDGTQTTFNISRTVTRNEVANSTAYAAGSQNGYEFGSRDLYLNGSKAGEVKFYAAFNNNTNKFVGVYSFFDGQAGSANFSFSGRGEIVFLHQEAAQQLTFKGLSDTPNTFVGQDGKILEVSGSSLILVDKPAPGTSGLNQTQVDQRIRALVIDAAEQGNASAFAASKIPSLPASRIGSGTFASTRIPKATQAEVAAASVNTKFLTPASIGDIDFTDLDQTPSTFTGQAGKFLAANSGGTALEFVDAPSGSGSVPNVVTFNPTATVNIATILDGSWSAETTLMETDQVNRVRKVVALANIDIDESTNNFGGGDRAYAEFEFVRVMANGTEVAISNWLDVYIRNVDQLAGEWKVQVSKLCDIGVNERIRIKARVRQQPSTGGGGGPTVALNMRFSTTGNNLEIRELRGEQGPAGPRGSSTFAALTDTPANFTGSGGKYLAVNSGASAVEFVDAPSGGGGNSKVLYSRTTGLAVDPAQTITLNDDLADYTVLSLTMTTSSSATAFGSASIVVSAINTTGTATIQLADSSGSFYHIALASTAMPRQLTIGGQFQTGYLWAITGFK